MKIVFANYFYDDNLDSELDLLRQYYTVVGWSEALQKNGCEVTVISRFKKNSEARMNEINYVFIDDGLGPVIRSWQIPQKLLNAISSLRPDIVHLHHLTLSLQTIALRKKLPRKTAIIIQHHGGKMMRNWKLTIHNWLHNVADGYFFTTREQGEEWFTGKRQRSKIMAVMEGGSFFNFDQRDKEIVYDYADRKEHRRQTGLNGSPVFLWVGRLDHNKDPQTVLSGFEKFVQQHPEARLYMIFNQQELLKEVNGTITCSRLLQQRVHLLGHIPHREMLRYYHSADYFVLGSHYEGSGYALSEALRCGCVPVVTDIPSFNMMTNGGQLGALWEPGNPGSFLKAINAVVSKPLAQEGKKCINFFREKLSFEAIAQTALEHYQQAINTRAMRIT
jgi:Glycosyltransferase